MELLALQAPGGARPVQRRPDADAEGVAEVEQVLEPDPARQVAALVPALHGPDRRQELLGEVVGGGLGRDVAAPLDAPVDDVAVAEHVVGERVREREPLQDHRAGGVDEDEGDAVRAEGGGDGALGGGGRPRPVRGLSGDAGDDHLRAVPVLQQGDEVGEGAVVGLHVELAAPEAGDAVVEHVAGGGARAQGGGDVRQPLRLALGGVAGAPALRRPLGRRQQAQRGPVAGDGVDLGGQARRRRRAPGRAGAGRADGCGAAMSAARSSSAARTRTLGLRAPREAPPGPGPAGTATARTGGPPTGPAGWTTAPGRATPPGRREPRSLRQRLLVCRRRPEGWGVLERGVLDGEVPLSRTSAVTCRASAKRCSSSAERRR